MDGVRALAQGTQSQSCPNESWSCQGLTMACTSDKEVDRVVRGLSLNSRLNPGSLGIVERPYRNRSGIPVCTVIV